MKWNGFKSKNGFRKVRVFVEILFKFSPLFDNSDMMFHFPKIMKIINLNLGVILYLVDKVNVCYEIKTVVIYK